MIFSALSSILDAEVTFEGIKRRFKLQGLTDEALTSLAAGETFEDEFDIASTSDLSDGGALTLRSSGLVPIVADGAVTGYLPYRSNDLKIEVDGAKASRVLKAINTLDRRTVDSCSDSSRKSALDKALKNTVSLANAAASAALSGSASKYAILQAFGSTYSQSLLGSASTSRLPAPLLVGLSPPAFKPLQRRPLRPALAPLDTTAPMYTDSQCSLLYPVWLW
jgi:hypothetical protein